MGWDHHDDIIPGSKIVTPPLDQAVTAFLEDVRQRGLTDDILLVITGEFGRTPYMKGTGRDHWPDINNVVFAGGGLKMGQVIGESDISVAGRRGRAPSGHRTSWPRSSMYWGSTKTCSLSTQAGGRSP
jgi:uncharacterized protein (DUF1501 family)